MVLSSLSCCNKRRCSECNNIFKKREVTTTCNSCQEIFDEELKVLYLAEIMSRKKSISEMLSLISEYSQLRNKLLLYTITREEFLKGIRELILKKS